MLSTPKVRMKFSDVQKIRIPYREEREFNVKGHKIMAYSREDAIKRLKHKNLYNELICRRNRANGNRENPEVFKNCKENGIRSKIRILRRERQSGML